MLLNPTRELQSYGKYHTTAKEQVTRLLQIVCEISKNYLVNI